MGIPFAVAFSATLQCWCVVESEDSKEKVAWYQSDYRVAASLYQS